MRTVVFLDLDDSLFQTRPKCPPGEPVRPAALRRDGTPLSFMTDRQWALLQRLSRDAVVIPTTARSRDAFRRVLLPFEHAAILDFGGVILQPDGELDQEWDVEIRHQVLAIARELNLALRSAQHVTAEQKLGLSVRIIADFDMPLYLVVKDPGGDASKLRPIRDILRTFEKTGRFFLHFNDNNLSLVPSFLGKEKAVGHVLKRWFGDEPVLTIGVGDSLTDAPFLAQCDFSLTPRGSQLARSLCSGEEA